MKLGTSKELFSYWSGLRGERSAPERSEIDPAAIRNVLADTFILELDQERTFRVAGARLAAVFGRELKGVSFLSLWQKEDRPAVDRLIFESAERLKPAVATAQASPRGRMRVELEFLLLPLRHYGRTRARMLGAATPDAVPTWLGLLAADPAFLTASRFLTEEDARATQSDIGTGAAAAEPLRHRHLFVHQGGRRDAERIR